MRLLIITPLAWLLFVAANIPLLALFAWLPLAPQGPGGLGAAAQNALLLALFTVPHSLLARPALKKPLTRLMGGLSIKLLYLFQATVTLSLAIHLWQPLRGTLWQVQGLPGHLLTTLYGLIVLALIVTTFYVDYPSFLGVRSLLNWAQNRPDPPPTLSLSGPYGRCRHPMYSLLILLFWTGPVMTTTRALFAALASLYIVVATVLEERDMEREMGEAYRAYKAKVPRWIPRLRG